MGAPWPPSLTAAEVGVAAAPSRVVATSPTRLVPAVGSCALRGVLEGPPRMWRVMGTTSRGWWCAAGDAVVVVSDDEIARLPNAVVVPMLPPSGSVMSGAAEAAIGDGRLRVGSVACRIVRWWDPQMRPVSARREVVLRGIQQIPPQPLSRPETDLWAALAAGPPAVVDAVGGLLGRGAGLTPDGDDYVTGIIGGYRHVAVSVTGGNAAAIIDDARESILVMARRATNRLSVSLLRHALSGHVAAPVGALLRALTGRGEVGPALADTEAIGHGSGAALVRGVRAGAAAALGVFP